jgi:hypothetical protein
MKTHIARPQTPIPSTHYPLSAQTIESSRRVLETMLPLRMQNIPQSGKKEEDRGK